MRNAVVVGRDRLAGFVGNATALVEPTALLIGTAVIAVPLSASAVTGDPAWAHGAVVAMSALIASERSGLAPFGVALQGIAIVAGVALLLAVAPGSLSAVASIAALAGACFVVTARGDRLRSLATFSYVPILYVAFEQREAGIAGGLAGAIRHVAPVVLLAIAPVMVVATLRHHRTRPGQGYVRHMARVMRWSDHGARASVRVSVAAVMLGTATAAVVATGLHLPHGQWAIWSAASVVSAEAVVRKLHDRTVGALVGVPCGVAAGLMLPASAVVTGVAAAVGLLTLIAVPRYRLAFGTRCGCVALALVASHQSGLAAGERAEDVVLGGVIGLAAFGLVSLSARRRPVDRPPIGAWRPRGSPRARPALTTEPME